jgi:anti-sigma-K factor RskA
MADDPSLIPEERDLLAAELALGVLEGDDRALALRLQVADPAFRADVIAWQTRLEPLLHDYAEMEAPDLWPAIQQRLLAEGDPAAAGTIGRIQRRLINWRRGALAAGALAAGLAAIILFRPALPSAQAPTQVAQAAQPAIARLGDAGAAHQFAVNYDATSGELRIRALKMPKSDLTPELWIIPADNIPRSLGLVAASGSTRVLVAPLMRALMTDGATLAITLEKPAGAPHKAPSSAPVAAGPINAI